MHIDTRTLTHICYIRVYTHNAAKNWGEMVNQPFQGRPFTEYVANDAIPVNLNLMDLSGKNMIQLAKMDRVPKNFETLRCPCFFQRSVASRRQQR